MALSFFFFLLLLSIRVHRFAFSHYLEIARDTGRGTRWWRIQMSQLHSWEIWIEIVWLIRVRIWIGAVNCKCGESMATWIRTYWAWHNWFPSTTEAVINNRCVGNLHIRRIIRRNSPDLIRNLAEWLWTFRPASKDRASDRFHSFLVQSPLVFSEIQQNSTMGLECRWAFPNSDDKRFPSMNGYECVQQMETLVIFAYLLLRLLRSYRRS